jgi:hypothetical protein
MNKKFILLALITIFMVHSGVIGQTVIYAQNSKTTSTFDNDSMRDMTLFLEWPNFNYDWESIKLGENRKRAVAIMDKRFAVLSEKKQAEIIDDVVNHFSLLGFEKVIVKIGVSDDREQILREWSKK